MASHSIQWAVWRDGGIISRGQIFATFAPLLALKMCGSRHLANMLGR
ncbi:MAG: hypothetical protein FWC10_01355 [Lentimicrobiaceae bacterium]|nr:hypothetical protein [Lentimicrobiaceae bacterium]